MTRDSCDPRGEQPVGVFLSTVAGSVEAAANGRDGKGWRREWNCVQFSDPRLQAKDAEAQITFDKLGSLVRAQYRPPLKAP